MKIQSVLGVGCDRRTNMTALACSLAFVATTVVHGGGQAPTREELLAAVCAQHNLLTSVEASVKSQRVCGPNAAVATTEEWIVRQGDKFAYRVRIGSDPTGAADRPAVWAAFDGEKALGYWEVSRTAREFPNVQDLGQYLNLDASDFWATLAWFPLSKSVGPDMSGIEIESILSNPSTVVRTELEQMDGYECAVVEARDNDKTSLLLWLAKEYSWLPVRQEHANCAGGVALLRTVDDVALLSSGAYVPIRGHRYVNPVQGNGELQCGLEYEFNVMVDEAGELLVGTSALIPQSAFELEQYLPPGTVMHSADLKTSYLVADRSAARASAGTTLALVCGDVSRGPKWPAQSAGPIRTEQAAIGLGAIAMATAFGIGLVVGWRSNSQPRSGHSSRAFSG